MTTSLAFVTASVNGDRVTLMMASSAEVADGLSAIGRIDRDQAERLIEQLREAIAALPRVGTWADLGVAA